jgi:hypothetical protein
MATCFGKGTQSNLGAIVRGATLALGCAGAAHAATPDLSVIQLVSPQTMHVGNLAYVLLDVWNIDQAYAGAYQAEILLSQDDSYDALDVVVQTVNAAQFSTQVVYFTVPATLSGGTYRFIARVLPVAGEQNVDNNVFVGNPVNLLATDLSVVDNSAIVFHSDFQQSMTLDAEVEIANLGNADSILLFGSELTSTVSWLEINLGGGFAIEGKAPALVTITCDATGLPFGTYETAIRFTNSSNPSDFEDVVVRLEVGNQRIVLGDRIRGQIGEPGETDEVSFDALAGTKLLLTGHVLAGDLKFLVTLIAPSGAVEHVINFKNSSKKLKKVAILEETGEYRMVFSGKGTTTGSFRVKTGRQHPALGRSRVETLVDSGFGSVATPVLLHADAKLDLGIEPGVGMAGPAGVELLDPQGLPVDLTAFTKLDALPELRVESFIAPELGEYTIIVSGLGQIPGNEVKVGIYPVQPPKGAAKVYVP